MNEGELIDAYVEHQSEPYEKEYLTGNCVQRQYETVQGSAGILGYSIDLLAEPPRGGDAILVEAKIPGLNFNAIGQILQYSYFFPRDRSIVRETATENGGYWDSKTQVNTFEHHVYPDTDEDGKTIYRPKQSVGKIEQRIIVEKIRPKDLHLLAVCQALGIDVEAYAGGQWYGREVYDVSPPVDTQRPQLTSWISRNSKQSLNSPAEDELARSFVEWISNNEKDVEVFCEVPVGRVLYNAGKSVIADMIIKTDDFWFVVEVKNSATKTSTRDFQKAFGQAAGYASLFSREWRNQAQIIVPVVLQESVPVIGNAYRRDRYGNDHDEMLSAAMQDVTQPWVFGPAETFG
ncbi:hypothetical protein [Halorussus marinus]|uniref:hypothetical protein n=1 Tax=Halorussus marinus TaxID=2505976 RepID=UPI00106EA832|nr:hypothetical protein [Halorussus marinus]